MEKRSEVIYTIYEYEKYISYFPEKNKTEMESKKKFELIWLQIVQLV